MKAAVLTKINQPLEIAEVLTTDLALGQVSVSMIASGICGSQLLEIKGYKGNERFLPHLMGHEGCGVVEEVGSGVSKVTVGDKVVLHWRQSSGLESGFPTYIFRGQRISSGKVTTLAEKVIVSENRITKVPLATNAEFAALLGCSLTTSLGLIERESNLRFGESVLVIGCGGLGLSIILASRLRGAGRIVGIDKVSSKESLCVNIGADEFHTSLSNSEGLFDLIIDTTGSEEVFSDSVNLLGDNGRLLLVGQPIPQSPLTIKNGLNLFNGSGHSIKATQGGRARPDFDIPRYTKLYDNGKIDLDALITHRYGIEEVNEAFDTLRAGEAGRIIIRF